MPLWKGLKSLVENYVYKGVTHFMEECAKLNRSDARVKFKSTTVAILLHTLCDIHLLVICY